MAIKLGEKDKDFAKAMSEATDEVRKAALLRRESRAPPANHEDLVEYFLNTVGGATALPVSQPVV